MDGNGIEGLRRHRCTSSFRGRIVFTMTRLAAGVRGAQMALQCLLREPFALLERAQGWAPVATGRSGWFDHWLHEPTYRAGSYPASVRASAACAADTPDPQ